MWGPAALKKKKIINESEWKGTKKFSDDVTLGAVASRRDDTEVSEMIDELGGGAFLFL